MRSADEFGLGLIIIFVLVLGLSVVIQHPWLLSVFVLAAAIYVIARRDGRRARGKDDDCGCDGSKKDS